MPPSIFTAEINLVPGMFHGHLPEVGAFLHRPLGGLLPSLMLIVQKIPGHGGEQQPDQSENPEPAADGRNADNHSSASCDPISTSSLPPSTVWTVVGLDRIHFVTTPTDDRFGFNTHAPFDEGRLLIPFPVRTYVSTSTDLTLLPWSRFGADTRMRHIIYEWREAV